MNTYLFFFQVKIVFAQEVPNHLDIIKYILYFIYSLFFSILKLPNLQKIYMLNAS